ncbi:MAG: PilZ domain-containing protein [Deltaproteobacteria bacterium]|nr:PilZ domain-containing protein [Deltaproteobacteria bacterium]
MPAQNPKSNPSAPSALNIGIPGASAKLDEAWSARGTALSPSISMPSKAGSPKIETTSFVPTKPENLPLGQILIKNDLITEDQLEKAINLQAVTPDRYIGAILVDQGYISQDKLDVILKVFNRRFLFGQLLVREKAVQEVDLAAALQEQKRLNHTKKIGEILEARGLISESLLSRLLARHLGGPPIHKHSSAEQSVARLTRLTSPAAHHPIPLAGPVNKPKPAIKFAAKVEFSDGEVILAPGKAWQKLFVLLSGEVKATALVNGSEVALGMAGAGDVIGELPGLVVPAGSLAFTAVGQVKLGIVSPGVLTSELSEIPLTTRYAIEKLFMREKQVIEILVNECSSLQAALAMQNELPINKNNSQRDKRMFIRRKVNKVLIQYRTHLGEFYGDIVNLSSTGIGILTRVDQPLESNIGVTFALPDNGKEISAKGTVVSSVKVKNGYRLGVKLTEFGYGAEKALRWFTFNFPPEEKA